MQRTSPPRRQLFCPCHPEQSLTGGGRRYFLHLESAEELSQQGMPSGKARLVIAAYPVRWASRDLWQQVAPTDPLQANPRVSEYSRRVAGRRAPSLPGSLKESPLSCPHHHKR